MSFRILLLVAAILRTTNGYLLCEYEHLHKCDLGFVGGFDDHPNDPDMSVYCGVFQVPNYKIIIAKRPNSNPQSSANASISSKKLKVEILYCDK